jgi:acetylornithine/N-succinyldiaminopimelate aminotransferase
MNFVSVMKDDSREIETGAGSPLLGVYRPTGPVFAGGRGSHLIAEDGRAFLDFTSGIAVNALGYGDAGVTAAIESALRSGLIHTSNLFRTGPATELARWLVDSSFADRVFFCNSGAEANEAAFKFARRRALAVGGEQKHEIVAFSGGFHGRTMGALSATDRPAYQDPFRPLLPGIRFAEVGSSAALEQLVSRERTAAVIIEPIQGEGGVLPIPHHFLRAVREICDAADASLIFDEVQVGLGRTGTLWAYQASGVEPDLLTLAKPLAGGLPMGAVLLRETVAEEIRPGDHATTFGGGPLVAAVALAVCRRIGDPAFLDELARKGAWLENQLGALALRSRSVVAVRGAGLIWGLEIEGAASDVVARAQDQGLLLCTAGPSVVRIVPPLTISYDDLEAGLGVLEGAL